MKQNDLYILEKLKLGDPDAFKMLFDTYYLPLCTYSLKYCDCFELAEDIVQDLFIKIWDEKLYEKFEAAIAPYLFKSIKNNTLQAIKINSKYRFEDIEDLVNKFLIDDQVDKTILEKEQKKLLKQIEALPKKSKEVFKAIVLENLKYKEVALQLNITVNTVKTHYSRALKQLRSSVEIIVLLFLI